MAFKTLAEIRSKVERDLDIEEEQFIQPQEFVEYVNDAISFAETHIEKLGGKDKYFLTRSRVSLVLGQEDYDLPENILTNKILKIVYKDGAILYNVEPIDSINMFEDIQFSNDYQTSDQFYRYLIRHDTPGEEQLQIVPAARKSVTDALTIWYIRDANKLEEDDDICDLPEIAMQYLYQFVKVKVYEKEKGPEWPVAKEDLQNIENLMIAGLTQQIQDLKLTEIEKDMSTYEEHS